MGKKTTRNEVSWSTPPATQATTNLQNMVDEGVDYSTPIRNAYARAEQDLNNSYQNPLGAYTTADVKDKTMRSQKRAMNQSMGMDLSEAAQQNAEGKFNRQATVAGLTRPQMYGSKTTVSDPWGTAMGFAGMGTNVASSALM